jgi:hypothetical protein
VIARPGGDRHDRRLLSFLAARLSDDATAVLKSMSSTDPPPPAQDSGPDPEHLLRNVVAKRALVQAWFDGRRDGDRATRPTVPDAVIAGLAGEYRDHPDFDPGWLRGRRR